MAESVDPPYRSGPSVADLHRHAALLPEEVRLEGWLGPTVFSSEARGERLATLVERNQAMWAHRLAGALVIGTIRETDGEPRVYAAYILEPGPGSVVLVDFHAPYRTRFVNSSIGQLGASLDELVKAWPKIAGADEAVAPVRARPCSSVPAGIDRRCRDQGSRHVLAGAA